MDNNTEEKRILRIIRILVVFFIVALAASGITAFPLITELRILCEILGISQTASPESYEGLKLWIAKVNEALVNTNKEYPFLSYGYDWLAFAHLVIAVAFIGVYMKPVRNIWVVHFVMIACIGVIPVALICGAIREIPIYWQLIDCSFGIFGIIPLYILHVYIKKLEKLIGFVAASY